MSAPLCINLEEEEDALTIDNGLLDKLQELELREDPTELGGMVAEVKRELQEGMHSPRVDEGLDIKTRSGWTAAFKQTSPSQSTQSTTGSNGSNGGSTEPIREKLAQSLPKSQAGRGVAFYSGRGDEDLDVRFVFEKVMERLSRIERRLDKWNQDQQRRIDQVIHHRHVSSGSVRSSDFRSVPPLLQRWAGIGDKGLMGGSKVAEGNTTAKQPGRRNAGRQEQAQPEREQSPLQEDEHTGINGCPGRGSTASTKDREIKQAVRDWVAREASDIKGSRVRKGSSDAAETPSRMQPTRQRSRSSTFLMLTTNSHHSKDLVDDDLRNASGGSSGASPSFLSRMVSHPAFDYFFATMIMLNAIFIGFQTEYRAVHVKDPTEPTWFHVAEKVFAGLFFLELALRIIVMKLSFFRLKHLTWNMFDLTLVLMSVIEVVLTESTGADSGDSGGSVGKVIRMFRMARIIRIMRVVRFLAELRIMVTLIIHSVRSLCWLMVLLAIILYVFSIFFTQGVTDYVIEEVPASVFVHNSTFRQVLFGYNSTIGQVIESAGEEIFDPLADEVDDLLRFYGGLAKSAITLFTAITGGISWADVVKPLESAGWTFQALFIIYIFFCVFSVLNIVTGVFVDGAIQRSAQERDLRLEKEKEQKKMYVTMLMDLLEEIDKEGTGTITRSELEEAFQTDVVRYSFSVLDIDIADSNYLFDMLDLDGSGEVDMEEFVSGCLRLKGNAKSIDIHTLMFEVKHLMRKMDTFMMDRY